VPTYSTQLFAGSLTAGTAVLFTPSSAEVCIVRDVELYGNFGAAEQVSLAVGVSGVPLGYFFFQNPLEPGAWHQWQGRVVLAPGQQLLSVSGAGGATAIVSGYLLVSP
jgi:hypothetical protein